MDYSVSAFFLIIVNLLHGGILAVFGVRDLIRKREEYDQKFNGLTYLTKGIALILISLFLYYLANGFSAAFVVWAMILAPLLSYCKVIWDSRDRIYRAVFESRAEILVQHNNKQWEQLEDCKLEYISTLTAKTPQYLHNRESE